MLKNRLDFHGRMDSTEIRFDFNSLSKFQQNAPPRKRQDSVFIRELKSENIKRFREEISVGSRKTVFEQTDLSIDFEKFNTIVTYIYNSTCPMKQLQSKRMNPKKPWMDQQLLKMINLRNEMYLDYLRFSGDERRKHFIDQRNKTNSLKTRK